MANPAADLNAHLERRTISGFRHKQEPTGHTGSFERLRERLLSLPEVLRPSLEPRSVALSAMLVADCMAKPEPARKLEAMAAAGLCDAACADDLRETARAVLYLLSQIGERPSRADAASDTGDARALRDAMIAIVDHELHDSDDARLWLEVVRTAGTDLDLVYDLRCLANLYRAHARTLAAVCDVVTDERRARELADALESELVEDEGPWGDWLARAWTLLVSHYEEVTRIGRLAARTSSSFPSLPTIARMRRRTRRKSIAPVLEGRPISIIIPETPPPPVVEAPAPEPRIEPRFDVEIEVGFASDSNFYMGFTENLSSAGVFLATYMLRPIGTVLDLCVQLVGSDEPLYLRGEVRWIRTPASDGWPGMGIRFLEMSEENEARIRRFLDARAPLFFDE
jgi:uncharacterized protein (TIGR02266 family)